MQIRIAQCQLKLSWMVDYQKKIVCQFSHTQNTCNSSNYLTYDHKHRDLLILNRKISNSHLSYIWTPMDLYINYIQRVSLKGVHLLTKEQIPSLKRVNGQVFLLNLSP